MNIHATKWRSLRSPFQEAMQHKSRGALSSTFSENMQYKPRAMSSTFKVKHTIQIKGLEFTIFGKHAI